MREWFNSYDVDGVKSECEETWLILLNVVVELPRAPKSQLWD